MKTQLALVLLLCCLTFSSARSPWTFSYPGRVVYGENNTGCNNDIDVAAGVEFEWERGWFTTCCIYLYSIDGCNPKDQIGMSCPDWTKVASQNIQSFDVNNCGE